MNSRENKLTRENVDEWIEQCLSPSQDSLTPAMLPLSSAVQDLQGIYEEECRLEHIWIRLNTRVSAQNAVRIVQATEELTVLLVQDSRPGTRRMKKRQWFLHLLIYLIILIALVAAIILAFTWLMWFHALKSV